MGVAFFGRKGKPAVAEVQQNGEIDDSKVIKDTPKEVLVPECIRIGLPSVTKLEAIEMAGQVLVDGGYVTPEYIAAMKERETVLSTYIGEGVAIPHGVGTSRGQILHSGICVLQFPEGIEYQ